MKCLKLVRVKKITLGAMGLADFTNTDTAEMSGYRHISQLNIFIGTYTLKLLHTEKK